MKYVIAKIFFTAFIVLNVSSLVFQPHAAFACSCIAPEPPLRELQKSSAVFSGRVSAVESQDALLGDSFGRPLEITFNVLQAWKGISAQTVLISTARHSASCGYAFVQGQEYLIYAHGEEGALEVSLCSRTNVLAQANADIAALGPGTPGATLQNADPMSEEPFAVPSGATSILIIAAIIIVVSVAYRLLLDRSKNA